MPARKIHDRKINFTDGTVTLIGNLQTKGPWP